MSEPLEAATRGSTRRRFLARSAAAVAGMTAVGAAGDWLLSTPSSGPPLVLGSALHAGDQWELTNSVSRTRDFRGPGALATPTIELVTQQDGSEARATLARTAPLSMRGKLLRIWLRVQEGGAASVRQINVQLGSGAHTFENYAYQAVVLVDDLPSYQREYLQPGEWVAFTICPASMASATVGEVDYDNVRDFVVGVSDDGSGAASVLFGGMQVIRADPAFPRGVVSLAFDDGLLSPYVHAKPVLDAHGYNATTFVIHDLVGARGYMDAAQLAEADRSGWELAMHTDSIAVHNAPRGLVDLQRGEVLADWTREHRWLAGIGASGARDLALPQGFFDRRISDLARTYGGFDTVRTANYRSIETLPVADPLRLRTIAYDTTVPVGPASHLGSIAWRIDQVAKYGGWLILSFHEVVDRHPLGSEVAVATFRQIVEHVARRRVPVRTIAEVWKAAGRRLDPLPPVARPI